VIIAGHGRLLAAKEIGLVEVSAIQISHLAPAQKKVLRLADNKIALNAGWDIDQLRIELAEIQMLDADMDLTIALCEG
jgi:ParB-like chromosome segregation protein Spo0J